MLARTVALSLVIGALSLAAGIGPANAQRLGHPGARAGGRQQPGLLVSRRAAALDDSVAPGAGLRWGLRGAPGPHLDAEALGLTEEQQAQLAALREQFRAEMLARREEGTRPTREEMEQIVQQHREQVEAILTEEQVQKLEEMRRICQAQIEEWRSRGQDARTGCGGRGLGVWGAPGALPAEQLGLTEEQQAQLEALREQIRQEIGARVQSGQRPTPEEMAQICAQYRAGLESILTEEQQAQLERLRARRLRCRGPATGEQGSDGAAADATAEAAKSTGSGAQLQSWGRVKQGARNAGAR